MPTVDLMLESGSGTAVDLKAGERLTIESPHGDQGGDLSFLEFDQALTRNVNGWATFGRAKLIYHVTEGMLLVDGGGETVMRVGPARGITSTDVMLPGCWAELYPDGRPGCRDLVSGALGIPRSQLKGMLSFFTTCRADPDGLDALLGGTIEPGDFVSFDAVRDVRVAVTACPDVQIAGWREGPLRVQVAPVSVEAVA